ncbi:MAG: zinc-ribbon domain-containing protein [Bacilli bacterium]|nr:zinc-ribbon domain-containing protein [Bacilli bacterium]
MSKFCTNCGNELNENAVFCVKCGVATNNVVQTTTKPKQPGKGTGIASMVLGIIATWNSMCTLFIAVCLLAAGEYFLLSEKIALGFIFLMGPITLLIVGGSLGIASRCKIKNGVNLTGLILNTVSLVLCLLSIIAICFV